MKGFLLIYFKINRETVKIITLHISVVLHTWGSTQIQRCKPCDEIEIKLHIVFMELNAMC
jgi:hypothetical protein